MTLPEHRAVLRDENVLQPVNMPATGQRGECQLPDTYCQDRGPVAASALAAGRMDSGERANSGSGQNQGDWINHIYSKGGCHPGTFSTLNPKTLPQPPPLPWTPIPIHTPKMPGTSFGSLKANGRSPKPIPGKPASLTRLWVNGDLHLQRARIVLQVDIVDAQVKPPALSHAVMELIADKVGFAVADTAEERSM